MYRFRGGFINTIKPYSDNDILNNLSIGNPNTDFVNITEKIREVESLEITKDTDAYTFIQKLKEINKDLEETYKKYTIPEINQKKFVVSQKTYKNTFKSSKADIINILTNIKTIFSNYLNINCHANDDISRCNNLDFFDKGFINKETQNNKYKEYIGNTFSLINFNNLFEANNINSYIILQKYAGDDNYYIIYNYNYTNIDVRIFLLKTNLSLNEITFPNNEEKQIFLDQIKSDEKKDAIIFYKNTNNGILNLFRGRQFDTKFINVINNILTNKKMNDGEILTKESNNILSKENMIYYKNNIDDIVLFLKKIYRFNVTTKNFLSDVYVYFDNIIIYLLFINKINTFIQIYNDNIIDVDNIATFFADVREHIQYTYNYYVYILIKYIPNVEINLNEYLKYTKEQLFNKFINNVKILLELINKIDKELVKDIIANFIINFLKKIKIFPVSKRKIYETITGVAADEINVLEKDLMLSTERYSKEDITFNYVELFKILDISSFKTQFEDHEFPDCGETMLFNLLNYLLISVYDENLREFKISKKFKLDKLAGTNLLNFYKEYEDYDDLISKYENLSTIQSVKNNFAKYISNIEDIQYNSRVCELIPSTSNTLKLINKIFKKDFNNLDEFVKYFDKNHVMDNLILDDNYELEMEKSHGSFKVLQKYNENIIKLKLFELLYTPETNTSEYINIKNVLLSLYDTINIYNLFTKFLEQNIPNNKIIKYIDFIEDVNFAPNNDIKLIHAATKYNNLEVVRELLNRGAYIDSKTIFNESPLIIAINNNNVDIVNLLLERNVKIDGNVFYSVIKNNNIDLLRFILDKKDYDVNTKEGYFDTLLNYAIINNKPEIVIELIRRGADVNLEKFGLSPLQHSIDNNNLKILNILIDNNVKCTLNILYDSFKYHISSFILLLNRISSLNIDINMISITYDDTLLHMAIKKNNIEIVKLLLEKGADPNIKNRAEQTPLEIAIFNYNIEIVKLLLEKGADPNIKNRAKQTSLEIAILINNIEIVKLLLEKGADPNIKNRDGQTLLEIAQYKDYDIIVNLLLEKGARGEIKIKSPYSTEIVEAVRKQNIELVKELLDKGADVNTIDKDNYGKRSLLHIATDKKNKDMINLLLDRGANIDIFDNNKETALHLAIGLKNIDIIYLLLKRGANIDIPKEKSARYIGLGILSRDIATMLSGGGLNQSSDFKNKYFKNKYLKYKTKYLQLKEKI